MRSQFNFNGTTYSGLYQKNAGPLLLLFHGLGLSSLEYEGLISALPSAQILALDMPGHGESGFNNPDEWPEQDIVAATLAWLKELAATQILVVCHSAGGVPGLATAMALKEKCIGYLSFEGNLIASDCGMVSRKASTLSEQELREEMIPGLISYAKERHEPIDSYVKIKPMAFKLWARNVVEQCDKGLLLERFKQLPHHHYVCGSNSKNPELLSLLDPEEKTVVSDCGHMMMYDQLAACIDIVKNFASKAS